jgi:hypothetical protein
MGKRRLQRPGSFPTLGPLGSLHQWRHKARASLRCPPWALGVAGIPQGEVRDIWGIPVAITHEIVQEALRLEGMQTLVISLSTKESHRLY